MVVSDNVWMSEGAQNIELGGELLALLLGHLDVIDLLATENLFE